MSEVMLNKVEMSFPSLAKRETYNGVEGKKFCATFSVDKIDQRQIAYLLEVVLKIRKGLDFKLSPDKVCLKDGDDEYNNSSTYQNCWYLKAGNSIQPKCYDKKKNLILDLDQIGSGSIVNAYISFWVQNNEYAKRINCNLHAIQVLEYGSRSEISHEAVRDKFDVIEDVPFELPADQLKSDVRESLQKNADGFSVPSEVEEEDVSFNFKKMG